MFKESPHLRNVLSRKFTQIPLELDHAFSLAKEFGGNEELDFIREEGVSFNPRSARIVLILLQADETMQEDDVHNALLSSCIKEDSAFPEDVIDSISPKYISRLRSIKIATKHIKEAASTLNLSQEMSLSETSENKTSNLSLINLETPNAQILIALFIDRMRHAHLATIERKNGIITQSIKESFYYEDLSKTYFPYYTPFIKAWRNRFYSKMILS